MKNHLAKAVVVLSTMKSPIPMASLYYELEGPYVLKGGRSMYENRKTCLASVRERQGKWENTSAEELIAEAKKGSGSARLFLASLYEFGDKKKGIPVDYEESVYWYKESLKASSVPAADICLLIAALLEEKIGDPTEAWEFYRKAYCLENKANRPALLAKIKKLEPELIQSKTMLEAELDELLKKEKLSDDDIRRMAFLIEFTQMPEFPEEDMEDEEKWMKAVLPKAEIIVREAFRGDPISENALGVFYSRGMVLPLDYAKQEYWFGCAYSDGYERAYGNLKGVYEDQNKRDDLVNLVIVAARHGNEEAQQICQKSGVDYKKPGPLEWDMLDLYPLESLTSNEATEERMALIERFSQTDDIQTQKEILRQLVPSTTEYYLDAFLNGKPYPQDNLLDKLMDTEDEAERRMLVQGLDSEKAERALQEIPYMPLTVEERRCINRFGDTRHCRSPHRSYWYSVHWNELSEKEQTVIRMMDADHRLTFDIADVIFDRYEQKLIADDAKQQEQTQKEDGKADAGIDEFWDWMITFGDSIYMKRQAYAQLKLLGRDITEESIKKTSAETFINLLNMELNPILHPLASHAATFAWNKLVERFEAKENI